MFLASKSQQWLSFFLKKMAVHFETYLNFRRGDFLLPLRKKENVFSCLFGKK